MSALDEKTETDVPASSGWGLFAIGGALGTAAAMTMAFFTMMARAPEPAYVDYRATEPITAAPVDGPTVTMVDVAASFVSFVGTEFAYDPASAEVAGDFEIELVNQGRIFHNLEIEGVAGFVLEANPGRQASEAIRLEPGTYTIFCSVAGHRAAGMEGELIVAAG